MPRQLFVFIQLEYPWALGPADGRYLIRRERDGEPERVVVLGTLGASRHSASANGGARMLRRRERARAVPPEPEPEPVSTSRVTVIDPVSLAAERQARAWLAELDREREVAAAVAIVNRVIHAQRIAAANPYVHEVSPAQALTIRAGWGEGEQVADGRWLHARVLPWREGAGRGSAGAGRARGARGGRSWALRPQERLAAVLGGRARTLLCEELVLRARQDLDHARLAHAALELERAYALALAELRCEGRQDLAIRLAELEQLAPRVGEHARATLTLTGAEPDEEALAHALERLEAALRARTATGFAG
ncbi:MAG TPA: hypothetical protein VKV16_07780 [Solirubrobacteraceae bacterium]|nr:hypothetical protein [Solirubrobacteraceae bacterium]